MRLVLKFGGTSMAGPERIARAARCVAAEAAAGHRLAVVVSAMAGETDRLLELARAVHADALAAAADEADVVLAAGEQVTSGLLALALRRLGLRARSWQGWQIPLRTDGAHAAARIADIPVAALAAAVDGGEIAVAPGFQGVDEGGRVTTLGRGGSDTSAVALAAALKAARCDIYTDVDGVYTTDPRIERRARRLDRISYEEMLEMASLGAKVLQTRSVELAMARRVPVRVLSSFLEPGAPNPGTLVCEEDASMEKRIVSGIAYSRDEARVTLFALPGRSDAVAAVFRRLAEAGVNVDMIVQSRARQADQAHLAFTVSQADLDRAIRLLETARAEIGFERLEAQTDLAKVSVVGVGMRSHAGVAHTMFAALAARGVAIDAISTSEIKISALIPADYTELAVRALHAAYGLDQA